MAKSNQNQLREKADAFGTQAKKETDSAIFGGGSFGPAGIVGDRAAATDRQGQTFGSAYQGYKQAQTTGGFDPTQLATLRNNATDLTKSGGFDPGAVEGLRSKLDVAGKTGGYDPDQLNYLRSKGMEFADTGGFDPGDLSRVKSGFGDFADTGGFSEGDKNTFLNRATSGVSGIYSNLATEAERRRNATGGLGTGGDLSRLARQSSQAQSEATLGAQDTLSSQIRAGKLAGLTGLSDVGSSVAAAKQGALSLQSGIESGVAAGNRGILQQQAGLESDLAAKKTAGVGLQAGIEGNVASGVNSANQGMQGLFNTSTGEVSDAGQKIIQMMGLGNASKEFQLSILSQVANTPGIFDNILRGVNAAVGVSNAYNGRK